MQVMQVSSVESAWNGGSIKAPGTFVTHCFKEEVVGVGELRSDREMIHRCVTTLSQLGLCQIRTQFPLAVSVIRFGLSQRPAFMTPV